MMEKIILSDYISLNKSAKLHISPIGARVEIVYPNDNPINKEMKKVPVANLNSSARDLLLANNGTKPIKHLIATMMKDNEFGEFDAETVYQEVTIFLQQLLDYNIIEKHVNPEFSLVEYTGDINMFFPQHMSIELTANCNLRCSYCYRDAGPQNKDYINTQLLLKSLTTLKSHGLRSLELTGGEPLLHPDFEYIFTFCADQFERVAVLSNGSLLNNKTVNLFKKYREKTIVQVDLDGCCEKTHDQIRGVRGSFIKTLNALKLLGNAKINTRVAMNVTKDNLYEIEDTLQLAKKSGAKWFSFTTVLNIGRGKNIDLVYSMEQIEYISNLINSFDIKYNGFFTKLDKEKFEDMFKNESNCGAGHRAIVIGPTGLIRPCPLLSEDILTFGNIIQDSIENIFSNPLFVIFNQIKSPNSETCSGCKNELYCRYCITRGILKFLEIQDNCNWGEINKIEKIIT